MPSKFQSNSWFGPGILLRAPVYITFLSTMVVFGVDSGITGSVQASTQWNTFFGNPTGSTLGILSAISTLGEIAGNTVAPYVNDRWGRKRGILVGCIIGLIATALQAGAVNVKTYLAARFFLGFGLLFAHNASPAMLSEFSPAKERPLVMGCYSPNYFVGAIVISWTCYSTVNWDSNWSWRCPSLVQAVPMFLQLSLLPFIPESPRWLAYHGREEEAKAVLVKYHGMGHMTEEVMIAFEEITESVAKQKAEDNTSRWSDLFRTKGMRIRTTIAMFAGIASQWSGNGLISYYIVIILKSVGITSSKSQTLFNGLLNVYSFLISIACAPLSGRVGRRPIFLWGVGGMFVVWVCFTGLSASYASNPVKGVGSAVLFFIFAFQTTYGAAWTTLFMYPVEMFPSALRSKSLAAQNSLDYVGLFMNIYVNPIAMDAIGWKYYIIYVVLDGLQVIVVYFLFVETNGLTLEQIGDYFDNGDPKWLAGPGSKKLLQDHAEEFIARRGHVTSAPGTPGKEKDEEMGVEVVPVPTL